MKISTPDMMWYLIERTDRIYNKIDNVEKEISEIRETTLTRKEYEEDKKKSKSNRNNKIMVAIAVLCMLAAWVPIIIK